MGGLIWNNKNFDPIKSGYVHYDIDNVNWDYVKIFSNSQEKNIIKDVNNITKRYKTQLNETLKLKKDNGEYLDLLFMDDNDVQDIFEIMVNQMNNNVEKYFKNNNDIEKFMGLKAKGRELGMQAISNEGTSKDYEDFMTTIAEALKLINSFNEEQWNDFKTSYIILMQNQKKGRKKITKEKERLIKNLENTINKIDKETFEPMYRVLNTLLNIPKNLIKNNEKVYTSKQMTGTLNSIFATTIGESLGAILEDIGIFADKAVVDSLRTTKSGSEQVKSFYNENISGPGTVDAVTMLSVNTNGVADMELSLNKNQNGKDKVTYTLEGQIASSIKWYDPPNDSNLPSSVHIKDISSFASLLKSIYSGLNSEYVIYNTLAFNNKGKTEQEDAFRIFRSAAIGKYLNNFIAGSGQRTGKNKDKIDVASFIMINGKFYSIFSILMTFIEDFKKEGKGFKNYGGTSNSSRDLIFMNIKTSEVNWIGEPEKPDLASAIQRSDLMKKELNKIAVTFSLNTKMLENKCKSAGITSL